MKFYIDTANVDEIRKANDMSIIAGVAHCAPLGSVGIEAPMGLFCKPHVQRGVMIALSKRCDILTFIR